MKYANLMMYSDIRPYEIVRVVSGKTIEIRAMRVERDPNWSPEIVPGGFAGHCVNQNSQKWIITSDKSAPVIRARMQKNGSWKSAYGRHVLSDEPAHRYDYNF